jgi:hypothetical protein
VKKKIAVRKQFNIETNVFAVIAEQGLNSDNAAVERGHAIIMYCRLSWSIEALACKRYDNATLQLCFFALFVEAFNADQPIKRLQMALHKLNTFTNNLPLPFSKRDVVRVIEGM